MTSETLPDRAQAPPKEGRTVERVMVADDGSIAAEKALADAADLAQRFDAQLIVAYIDCIDSRSLREWRPSEPRGGMAARFEALSERLHKDGIRIKSMFGRGAVAAQLKELCGSEGVDLLFLGAYGYGNQDRHTLGSTPEQLLRSISCPCVVYGPNVSGRLLSNEHTCPALLPVSLPCVERDIVEAVNIARIFDVSIEIFHSVMRRETPRERRWFEEECSSVAGMLRGAGVRAEWSLLYGDPDITVCAKSTEVHSPFILMPLKPRSSLSLSTSDNVAANVIRRATVPVITYR